MEMLQHLSLWKVELLVKAVQSLSLGREKQRTKVDSSKIGGEVLPNSLFLKKNATETQIYTELGE